MLKTFSVRLIRGAWLFALLCTLTATAPVAMYAQNKSAKVRSLERERNSLLKSIGETDKKLKAIKNDVNRKQKEAQLLQKQAQERARLVAILDKEIDTLNASIQQLQQEITVLSDKEEASKKSYARSAQALQRRKNQTDRLLFVLSAKDFDQGMRRMRFITQYARAHKEVAAELQRTRKAIELKQSHLVRNKKEKSNLLALRQSEKKKLEQQSSAVSHEAGKLSKQQGQLEKQLKQQRQKAQRLEARIKEQIAWEIAEAERKAREEQERLEREAKAKGTKVPESKQRQAATKGGYAMDATERKLAGSFAANKGKLPPPVNAPYSISRGFGKQAHSSLSHVQTENGGIDLAVAPGTQAVAVFDGVVSKVFIIPGYNTSVIIRHGNYLTVYSNLSSVNVQSGQRVKTGQKLGPVAKASDSDRYILQFQVWHERQKTNPQHWIR